MISVLLLLGAIAFSYVLNKILLRFSRNFGVDSRQAQNLVRWASTSKPTTGGISFYITFLIGALILLILFPEIASGSNTYLALFLSATLAFMIGFADDAYGTHPLLKFLGQLSCGGILLYFGFHIHFFSMWSPSLILLDYGLTLFWVVGIMNSLNMLDNMDAVTTTIAITIVMISMAMSISLNQGLSNLFYVFIVVLGGFMGFLFWNWRPAKIYMGDTGSMFIGMILAFAGILYFWNIPTTPDNISHIRRTLIPLMVFLVPIMDTSFVTFARIARGGSPFVGGRDHLTHHLVHVGVPEFFVPITLGITSLVSGGLALFVYYLIPEWSEFYSLLFGLYPVLVFSLFIFLYRKGARIARIKDRMAERERLRLERLAKSQPDPQPSILSGQPS